MTVVTYTNHSPTNYVPKKLTEESTVTGILRAPSSVQTPTFMLQQVAVPTFNYCYLTEFGRYYYVTDITNFSTNLWAISLHCDPLQSFWTSVKQNQCIVGRNQFKRTADLKDDELWATADSLYSVQKFPNSPFSSQVDRRFVLLLNGAGYNN